MPSAIGVAKRLSFSKESTWGTQTGTGTLLRRVTSDIDLDKDTYQSNEIISHYQIGDFRHGARRVTGNINGEISPGAYAPFIASSLRGTWGTTAANYTLGAAGTLATSATGITLTVAGANFLTSGKVKRGEVVRLAGTWNTANATRNLLVTGVAATVMTAVPVNYGGTGCVAETVTGGTLTRVGKAVYTPVTGHVNESYSIEHWFSDITKNELFTGCRVNSVALNLPSSGMATVQVGFLGKDVTVGTAAVHNPGTATTAGVCSAVNGLVCVAGTPIGYVTGMNFTINGNAETQTVVGSVQTPDVFMGRVVVTGQLTAVFQDTTLRDAFLNETELSIIGVMYSDNSYTSEFVSFSMPRVKVGGARKSDGEKSLIITAPFQALYYSSGSDSGTDQPTTLWMQDSQAP